MKDSLIVVSGGMDSITLLYEYADRIALAVSFDYGANHNHKEIPVCSYSLRAVKNKTYSNTSCVYERIFQKFVVGR